MWKRIFHPPTNLWSVLGALIDFVVRRRLGSAVDVPELMRMRSDLRDERRTVARMMKEARAARDAFAARQVERYRRFRQVYEGLRARYLYDREAFRELDRLKGQRGRAAA